MAPYFESDNVTLFEGDALTVARELPRSAAQTIVTSPPYFGLRDYGVEGQLGGESSVDEYVGALVDLFRELRRVLADDGTLWLNLGDSYNAYNGNRGESRTGISRNEPLPKLARGAGLSSAGLAAKNLLGVPWRVAFALQADGWILRSDIVWAKPNPMPESVTDRPTKAHEYVFLFAKSPRYYYDAEAIREPYKGDRSLERRARTGNVNKENAIPTAWPPRAMPAVGGRKYADGSEQHRTKSGQEFVADDRANRRSVWTVATQPFPGAHFATYPPELIRPCILAGSRPGDVVLDPFSGSGTTGAVATMEGRRYIGIDLNREYLDLSLRTRFAQPSLYFEGEVS